MTNRQIALLFSVFLLSGLMLSLAAMVLLTVEFDEAWIISSHLNGFYPDMVPVVRRVLTTGGLHPLIVGSLGTPGPEGVALARGLSFVCLLLLLVLIERMTRIWLPDLSARMIVLLMVLATPGTVFLGAMGYGVMLAVLLLLSGMVFWIYWEGSDRVRVLVTGSLLGLALITRWTLLPLFPLLLCAGALLSVQTRHRWALGVVMTAWAFVIFAGYVVWHTDYFNFSGQSQASTVLDTTAASAGIGFTLPPPARITGFVSRFFTLASAPVILSCLVIAFVMRQQLPDRLRRVLLGLTAAFVVIALAWALRSPFLHTRYVWPAILMANLASGLVLAYVFTLLRQEQGLAAQMTRIFCLIVPLGLATETYTIGVRLIAMGASYETNNAGYSGQEYHFDAFRLHREQAAISRFLTERTSDSDIIQTVGLPAQWNGMQLSLLTQRDVTEFDPEAGTVPDWLITHDFAQLSQTGTDWLQSMAGPPEVIFGYRIYAPDPAQFAQPDGDILSNSDLYRFSLKRAQSQSGY